MNPTYQPTGWIDLIPYLLVAIPSLATVWLGVRNAKLQKLRHRENRAATEELKYEITNDHSTNLRHDIDAIHKLLSDGFSETRRDIGGLREELRTERLERIAGDKVHVVIDGTKHG